MQYTGIVIWFGRREEKVKMAKIFTGGQFLGINLKKKFSARDPAIYLKSYGKGKFRIDV